MKTLDAAIKIAKKLKDSGFTAYFAGGWVRDYLLDHPSEDIDIATDASPEDITNLFEKTIPVGISFGVVIVVQDKIQIEVASFRMDGPYLDGRRPASVTFSSPKEDAKRRDFTINGMFWDPIEEKIYDFVGGKEDLEKKIIRTIGSAKQRFEEDRLRMIRAVRFAHRFSFTIEEKTEKAIVQYANNLMPSVAIERVYQELSKMAKAKNFDQAIITLHRLGLLQAIFPDLSGVNIEELTKVWKSFPKSCPVILYVISLFPAKGLKEKLDICRYLKVSSKEIKLVELFEKAKKIDEKIELVEFYAKENSDLCLEASLAGQKELIEKIKSQKKELAKHIERKKLNKPLVSSAHLKKLGISPGKQMGELLKEAEKIAIENDFNTTEEVLKWLKIN